jgi:hypothetical protein
MQQSIAPILETAIFPNRSAYHGVEAGAAVIQGFAGMGLKKFTGVVLSPKL